MKTFFVILAIICAGGALSFVFRTTDEAAQVVHDEFGPKAMLAKYEWFKDAAAQLDARSSDIAVYEQKLKHLSDAYGNKPRNDWSRDDREAWNIDAAELAGMKASFNHLAAEYNSQMSKFNWRFAEAGTLPKGATTPLPREYKPYVEK
jgi:hypothetical protein